VPTLTDHALAAYQVDTLILLVGSNPLPNAVSGRLLVRPGGRIVLVKTTETERVAQHLGSWLTASLEVEVVQAQVDDSDASTIYHEVYRHAARAVSERRRLGLNYTGGTKAMAVHAYRAVEAATQDGPSDPVFSYLDARDLSMKFDPPGTAAGQSKVVPIGTAVPFTLRTLAELHGWKLAACPKTEPVLLDVSTALAQLHQDRAAADAWCTWCVDVLEKQCRRAGQNWLSSAQLRSKTLEWPTADGARRVVAILQERLGSDSPDFSVGALAERTGLAREEENLCRWLHGVWLESYVLDAVRRVAAACGLNSFGANIKGQRTDPDTREETNFEFDAAAIRGYQLFGFSCTTAGKDLTKSKLFEAYIRARQLGGDEARVGLVCSADDPGRLERQLQSDFVDTSRQIRVFGRPHLADLAEHVAAWIQDSSAGRP